MKIVKNIPTLLKKFKNLKKLEDLKNKKKIIF